MYPLFFGLLFIALCGIVGLGDGFLVLRSEYRDMRYADGVLQDEGRRYWNKEHGLRTMDVVGFLVWRSAYCDMRMEYLFGSRRKD